MEDEVAYLRFLFVGFFYVVAVVQSLSTTKRDALHSTRGTTQQQPHKLILENQIYI